MLRELGLLERLHSIGAELVFFPPAVARPPLSAEEQAKLEESRERAAELAGRRRTMGAAGGMQPGALSASEVERRQAADRDEEDRNRRQLRKAREARAALDAKAVTT